MAGTSSRGNPSMADVVRSVLVLGLIILGLWVVGRLVTVTPDEPTPSVDYAQAAQQVADAVPYAVLSPPSLPNGWRATSARLDEGRWHLGVVTDGDDYVGLEQEQTDAASLVKDVAPGSKPGGEVTIAGSPWTERTASDGDITYVRTEGRLTTLVTGSVPKTELKDYIASLAVVTPR